MTNFSEQMNTLLYKNMYLSHFILDVSVVCERWVEIGTDCYIDPTSSLDHRSTSSASWLGLLNRGSLRAASSVCKLVPTLAFLSSTKSTAAGTCLYFSKRPLASFLLLLIYTGASLDWQLGQGSIYKSCSSITLSGRAGLFLLVQENIPYHRIVVNPQNNIWV